MSILYKDEVNSILAVLRLGCDVILPNGSKLESDLTNGYISPVVDGESLGLWNMDYEGTVNSLKDVGYTKNIK